MLSEIIAASIIAVSSFSTRGQVNPFEAVATIEIHAFTASTNPHAYLVVKNLTSSNLVVGYKTVAPYDCVTIGKWSASVLSSSGGIDFSGVFYDLEKYRFCNGLSHGDDIYLSSSIFSDEMASFNYHIQSLNNGYNFIFDNCVTFARDAWNSFCYPQVSTTAFTPLNLYNSIAAYPTFEYCESFNSTSYFYSYDTSTNQLITYS